MLIASETIELTCFLLDELPYLGEAANGEFAGEESASEVNLPMKNLPVANLLVVLEVDQSSRSLADYGSPGACSLSILELLRSSQAHNASRWQHPGEHVFDLKRVADAFEHSVFNTGSDFRSLPSEPKVPQ